MTNFDNFIDQVINEESSSYTTEKTQEVLEAYQATTQEGNKLKMIAWDRQ